MPRMLTNDPRGLLSRHFSWREFDCHDGTIVPVNLEVNVRKLVDNLEVLRFELESSKGHSVPINILSGFRTPSWNKKVNGRPRSQHLKAKAADITVPGFTPTDVRKIIIRLINVGRMMPGAVLLYPTFVHYDVRGQLILKG